MQGGFLDQGFLDQFHVPVCMEICSVPNFCFAVFILPAGFRLPLHDHPSMSVLCKLVAGNMTYISYTRSESEALFECTQTIKTPDDPTWFLTPTLGNYHEFIAHEDCVLLDAIVPPYHEPERSCNY